MSQFINLPTLKLCWILTHAFTHVTHTWSDVRYFHHPRKFLHAPCKSAPDKTKITTTVTNPTGSHCVDSFHHRLVFPVPEVYAGIIHDVLLCVWLLSLRNYFWDLHKLLYESVVYFFFMAILLYGYFTIDLSIHCSRHLDCLKFEAIMNKNATDILVLYVCLQKCLYLLNK